MNKHLFAVVLCTLCWCPSRPSLSQDTSSDEVLEELLQKNAETVGKWDSGFIDAKVEFHEFTADVIAYWEGDRSRRISKSLDLNRNLSVSEIVYHPRRYCRLSHAILTAECDTVGVPEIPHVTRVLPTEVWNHIGTGMSVPTWLRHEFPQTKTVIRTSDGYDVYLGNKEHLPKIISSVASQSVPVELPENEYVVRTHFNRHGLLVSSHYYGTPPANTLLIENSWTDGSTPVPKVLSTKSRTASQKEYTVMFRLTAKRAGASLPDDAPSLAIPPTDVPFGWKIINHLGDKPAESYVGGEEGKAHWDRHRVARRLVAEFRAD